MTSPTIFTKVQHKIWAGQVPLEITLSSKDSRDYDQTTPYIVRVCSSLRHKLINPQLLAPRISYLPLLLPKLHAFFKGRLINPSVLPHEGWFSVEEVPLKWHHPIGLLHDLYSGAKEAQVSEDAGAAAGGTQNGGGSSEVQPWKIMLHFSDWPREMLIPIDEGLLALKDAFQNSVKEVCGAFESDDMKLIM